MKRIIYHWNQFILNFFDKEIKEISKIIKNVPNELRQKNKYNDLMQECDSVFVDRLAKNKIALKLEYWKTHFEVNSLKPFPQIKNNILDFGCGSGNLDVVLARNGYQITGFDASPIGIEIANYLKSKESETVKDRLNFRLLNITEPKIGDDWFDSVWSTQVFEHILDPEPIINGLRQYVKPGAYFLICVPYKHAYDDPGHCNHFYSEEDLHKYLSPCIEIEKIVLDIDNQVLRALCRF